LCLVFGSDINENFQASNEAVQNVSAIYNTGKLTVTNADIGDTVTAKKLNIADITSSGNIVTTGKVTGSNLTVSSPDTSGIYNMSLDRKDEDGKSHTWSLWHMNKTYGDNDLQFWEYKAGDDGKTCGSTTGICGRRFSLLSGGGASVENDLTVKGNMTIDGVSNMNPLRRKHDIAGYFKLRAWGYKTPLYYGWNQMWQNHDFGIGLMKRHRKPVYYPNINMWAHSDNDPNWTPRHLVVFPGYIARFYYNDIASTAADVYPAGEYDWENYDFVKNASPGNGKRVILIYISLAEEGAFPDTRNPGALTT
jgi:hypothetical protein